MILHHTFIKTAKKHAGKLALVDRSTAKKLSYAEMLIATLILAKHFKHLDEKYLGIMLPTSAGCCLSVLACSFLGKIPVMINYSTGAEKNINFSRDKCGFQTVITARTVLSKVDCPEMPGMLFIEDILKDVSLLTKVVSAAISKLPTRIVIALSKQSKPDDTAAIIFTSGSEKAPKGVELTHRGISAVIEGIDKLNVLSSDDIKLAILPLFHVYGFTTNLWLPLFLGMRIITYANPLEAKNIVKIIREEKPTMLVGTPFFLMNYERCAKTGDLASLRVVVAGADKMPDWLFETYKQKHGIEVIEGYGATETSPVVSVNPPGAIKRGSIGKPLAGVSVKITDINSGEELATGQQGKILVKGDILMKGYFNDVEETALKIENGWYETGDMGVMDSDGYLWHRGRLKRFVKIGGEMVSLVQIESELEKILPDAIECCVVEIPDAKKGAMIAVATSSEIDDHSVKKRLKDHLPAIALPKQYVVISELPKMGSGKIDFRSTTELVKEKILER